MIWLAMGCFLFAHACFFVSGFLLGRKKTPRPRCPESYWHGYRRGFDDGVVTTVHHERTPSLN